MTVDPGKVHALVVGIEKYAERGWRDLDGPALDAFRFADWLLARGVPPENVHLFVSPLPKNAAARPAAREDGRDAMVAIASATAAAIHAYLEKLQEADDIDLLYVFWGGHGVSDIEGSRHLLFDNAVKKNLRNLRLSDWLASLRTTAHAGVRRQICFIDTCANDKRELGVNVDKLPGMTFPVGDRRQACQYVLYASRLGEAAMNRDARQTGALSDEVLKALAGQPLLPDMTSVGDGVRRAFEAMRKRGELRQVPIEFVVTDWDGREESHSFRRGKRGQYSSIAPLMYDRRPPEAVFWEHPEALLCKTPGIHAQAFLVPGIEGERHEGFVERLLSTKVHECARTWLGHADDAFQDVRPMVRWPEGGVQDAGVLHKLLHVALVQALGVTAAPGHAGTTTGWEVLAQSRYAAYPIVVIPHLIDVKDWGARQRRRQAALMRWYLETYWNRPTADSGTALPRVMLFLLLQCDGPMAMKDGLRRVLGLPCRKDIVTDDMRAALGGVSVPWWSRVARGMGLTRAIHAVGTATTRGVVSCVPLSELTPLEPEHLRDWLRDYVQPWEEGDDYAYVTEARMLYDRAARRPDGTPRTDSIEPQLRKRYDEAARAAGEDV